MFVPSSPSGLAPPPRGNPGSTNVFYLNLKAENGFISKTQLTEKASNDRNDFFMGALWFLMSPSVKTSEKLLYKEFIIIERVKLLFHLFRNPPSVIK